MKKRIIIRLVSAGLMIIVGTNIYIISRHDIIFFKWIPASIIDAMRSSFLNSLPRLSDFVVYSLPDGLWYGALLLFQSVFLDNTHISKSIYWFSIILPFIWEILQIRDHVPGTFDPMDLLVYFFVITIFLIFSYNRHAQK